MMSMETNISLHVVYDGSGNIIAAAIDDRSLSSDHIPLPRPVPQKRQFAATLAVPPEAGEKDLRVIAETYVVKGRGESARLVQRSSTPQKLRTAAVGKPFRRSTRKKPPAKRR